MTLIETLLLGLGLSMDAAAVSMSNAMVHRRHKAKLLEMAALFGLFQALMPVLGWLIGGVFSTLLKRMGGVLVLLILGFIGGQMIRSGLCSGDSCPLPAVLTHRLLLMQAVATSIDAFAVGVSLRATDTPILTAALLIGLITFVCSIAALRVGERFGDLLGKRAEIFGGVVLVLIGIRSVL